MVYEKDELTGPSVFYTSSGTISTICYYKASLLHGEMTAYDDKKAIVKKTMYEDGKMHGPSYIYYPSGQIFEESYYEKDQLTGDLITYYENGEVLFQKKYAEGKLLSEVQYDKMVSEQMIMNIIRTIQNQREML